MAGVEIMAGKVMIDKDGNLAIEGEVKAKKVTAQELCLGEVCVSPDQLQKLLEIIN